MIVTMATADIETAGITVIPYIYQSSDNVNFGAPTYGDWQSGPDQISMASQRPPECQPAYPIRHRLTCRPPPISLYRSVRARSSISTTRTIILYELGLRPGQIRQWDRQSG